MAPPYGPALDDALEALAERLPGLSTQHLRFAMIAVPCAAVRRLLAGDDGQRLARSVVVCVRALLDEWVNGARPAHVSMGNAVARAVDHNTTAWRSQ